MTAPDALLAALTAERADEIRVERDDEVTCRRRLASLVASDIHRAAS